jgi:hypothetical protein
MQLIGSIKTLIACIKTLTAWVNALIGCIKTLIAWVNAINPIGQFLMIIWGF